MDWANKEAMVAMVAMVAMEGREMPIHPFMGLFEGTKTAL